MSASNQTNSSSRSGLHAASAPRSDLAAVGACLQWANAVTATTGPDLVLDQRTTRAMAWNGTGNSVSGQAVDLGRMPVQRQPEFRLRQSTNGIDTGTRDGYMIAFKAQAVGHPPAFECTRCEKGNGPFTSCQVVDGQRSDGEFYLRKGCANCFYGDQTSDCTFKILYDQEIARG